MDERENRRKAKEREQESSGASEKYTQVFIIALSFSIYSQSFYWKLIFVLYYLMFIIVIYNSFVTRVVS